MNTNKCHINVLLVLCKKKNAGTILFFQIIFRCILVGMIVIFAHTASLENQKSRKQIFFILDPKPRKNFNKAKERLFKQDFCMAYTERIILLYFFHICGMQHDMIIYNYVV